MAEPHFLKRKQNPNAPPTASKRVKFSNVRTILAQASDKALSQDGELDVSAFVKAREVEIRALEASIGGSKASLNTRAFQKVPCSMRRRTASHNVKRVPKRIRGRAEKEMRDDNTPTKSVRRRELTPHKRLRLETAKRLQKLGNRAKAKKKLNARKLEGPGKDALTQTRLNVHGVSRLKKNALSQPPRAQSKYRKRQVHKSWLPTHLYHAKRAHMSLPKEPLWRFAIALTPTEKSYRATHRAMGSTGCVVWDMSYISTLGVEGVEGSLIGLLTDLGIEEGMVQGKQGKKWRAGTRSWNGWLKERDGDRNLIAPAAVAWCTNGSGNDHIKKNAEAIGKKNAQREKHNEGKDQRDAEAKGEKIAEPEYKYADRVNDLTSAQMTEDTKTNPSETVRKEEPRTRKRKEKRRLIIRVHPSAFLQLWNETLKVAKIQRPSAKVEDLRFEIGSIDISGPGSTEALVGALQPILHSKAASPLNRSPEEVWTSIWPVINPASLPLNAVLGFEISDPRLHHPLRTVSQPEKLAGEEINDLLQLLSTWPPDSTQNVSTLFDRSARLMASRSLPSQKAINRRKGAALPGAYPDSLPTDPKIPVLLVASRPTNSTGQGSWTLMLPWKCVLPVWYSLMHYPLSTGSNPRFGGLRERRQLSFEQGVPWFPGDYPGTKAGWEWEVSERRRRMSEWEKRPKGKRIEWDSVNLQEGRKGEIGLGWACDWEHLFHDRSPVEPSNPPAAKLTGLSLPPASDKNRDKAVAATSSAVQSTPRSSLSLHQLPLSLFVSIISSLSLSSLPEPLPSALVSIKFTLLARGTPTPCARIYRLPTTNPTLLSRWLALASSSTTAPRFSTKKRYISYGFTHGSNNTPQHEKRQRLAASLLPQSQIAQGQMHVAQSTGVNKEPALQADDAGYPCVPGEGDLVGFVTTGNFNLSEGKGTGIGCVAVERVLSAEREGREFLIVREAGFGLGRLVRWEAVG